MMVFFTLEVGHGTLRRLAAAAVEHETDVGSHAARACRAAAMVWLSTRATSVVPPAPGTLTGPAGSLSLSLSSAVTSVLFGIASSRGEAVEAVIRGVLDAAVDGYELPELEAPAAPVPPSAAPILRRPAFDPKRYAGSRAVGETLAGYRVPSITAALLGDPGDRSALAGRRTMPAAEPAETFKELFPEEELK